MVLKRILLISFFIVFPFLVKQSHVFAQKKIPSIHISSADKKISLLQKSAYATSGKELSTLKDLQHINWKLLDSSLIANERLPDTVLQYWVKFTVQNDFASDTSFILKFTERNQQSELYEVVDEQLKLLGQTGFGSKISNLSIEADYARVFLPLKKGKKQVFYTLVTKYQYNIAGQYPEIESLDYAFKEKIVELTVYPTSFRNFKLWTAGFYFAVFIYCSLKFFFQRKEKSYLYYALASLFLFFRYSLQVDAILLETNWLPTINNDFIFLLSFIPQSFFYILFLGEFLQVKESKYIHWFLNFCLLQWCLMIGVMLMHFFWPTLSSITGLLWKYNAVPFFILTILLSYHTYTKLHRQQFKFALVGVIVLATAFLFVVTPRWLEIWNLMPSWYHAINKHVDLITLAFAIDTVLFLTTLAHRDRIDEVERNNLKIKNAENEHKILRLQMNPHFIFNCLNSIKLYIEQNNSSLASNYLSKFSQLMRLSLVQSRKDKIILSEELSMLKLYLELETMRFKGKLNYSIDINDDVDLDFVEIPPMLIQPHLENAIWHGLMHKTEGGNILMTIRQDFIAQTLNVTIQDNGVGRAKAAALESKAVEKEKSYGTLITSERIAIFNEKFKADNTITIKDLFDEKDNPAGTLVIIKIHLI